MLSPQKAPEKLLRIATDQSQRSVLASAIVEMQIPSFRTIISSNRAVHFPVFGFLAATPYSLKKLTSVTCRSERSQTEWRVTGGLPPDFCQRPDGRIGRKSGKKNPHQFGMGLKIPSLRWIREGQTLLAGDAEAMTAFCNPATGLSVSGVRCFRNDM